MSVLRQHTVLLDIVTPIPGPLVGAVHQFTPSDADNTGDAQHEFAALVELHRGPKVTPPTEAPVGESAPEEEPASATIALSVDGSFGGDRWIRLGGVSLGSRDNHVDKVVPLGPMPPLLRVRVVSPREMRFSFAAYVAVGSSAPYRARIVA